MLTSTMSQVAAVLAALILAGLICFQLLLAAGLPLGHYAWGGAHRVLPRSLRIASVVATFIYLALAMGILEAASVVDFGASELPRVAVWVLAAFFGIGVVMNAISRSEKERRMAFVAAALSALCAIVGLGL
jgi:cytochrome bd-type quinol oxidase subunit 2